MQEIIDRLKSLNTRVQRIEESLNTRVQRIEDILAGWEKTLSTASKKESNALRRKQYHKAKKRREEGLLALPVRDILEFRDMRIDPLMQGWASMGMRFGRADQPEQFYTWLIFTWNNCTYLKKPITFSGSSFRIWKENYRYASGSSDLMGFVERKSAVTGMNKEQHDDFTKRPWWGWSSSVFSRVISRMEGMGFDTLPERFRRCCSLMLGGTGCWEVYTDLHWDFEESQENINKMLRRVGVDLQLMLRAAFTGLRVRGTSSPITLPPE